ncbi:energy transducer TonB [Saccharicrinis sp. FJH2]|uniref:energy transducer TonB n=1 Tax=Saccharicrinis sp. FJH65 TaxID=3344659 RepID=UPI0035F4080D
MKKIRIILFSYLLIACTNLLGQINSIDSCNCEYDKDIVFGGFERMASFPCGQDSMFKFIERNITYPEIAKTKLIQGTVYIQFCINRDGELKKIKVVKGTYDILNNEALRIVKKMPNWNPAIKRGKPVCSNFMLPINFKLDSPSKRQIRKEKRRRKDKLSANCQS